MSPGVVGGFGVGVQLLLSNVSGRPGDEPLLGTGPITMPPKPEY